MAHLPSDYCGPISLHNVTNNVQRKMPPAPLLFHSPIRRRRPIYSSTMYIIDTLKLSCTTYGRTSVHPHVMSVQYILTSTCSSMTIPRRAGRRPAIDCAAAHQSSTTHPRQRETEKKRRNKASRSLDSPAGRYVASDPYGVSILMGRWGDGRVQGDGFFTITH